MKVIWFNGNLGNQVFYCKYKDYLRKKYPNEKVYAYIDPKCPKVVVAKYFDLVLPEENLWVNALSFFVFKVVGALFRRIPAKMIPSWYSTGTVINEKAIFIGNFLQTKSYYEDETSSWLKINDCTNPSKEYKRVQEQVLNSNSVSVHIRRGDYVRSGSSYVDLSATDYYDSAMAKALALFPDCQFFFFSDDLDYVKSRYKGDNIHYVACNRGDNSYLDIKLMSLAKVNIMANSTFSYWGAYIGNENKTVIYPLRWFNEWTGLKTPDIMLNSWIGM